MYNFDEIIPRNNTNSIKYGVGKSKYPALPDDHLPMWVADMDFACPQPIIDAMKARLDKRILGYSAILDPAYYQALGDWMQNRHHWTVDPYTSLFTPGIIFALRMAVQTLTSPSDSVLIQTPAYAHFKSAAEIHNRTIVQNPLRLNNGRYEIDWLDFEQKAKDPNVTLFFLCNPHNPTGRVWTKEELTRMGEICFANNVFVISDEIHFDFIRQNITHTVFASLFPKEKRIITCTAPSKTFNLAGNQLSNIFFADETIKNLWQNTHLLTNPNPLSIDACTAAYAQCGDWVDALNLYLDENFRHFQTRINQELPYVNFVIPESTYLAWVDLSGSGYPLGELKSRITNAGLFIEYEDEFVANGEGHVRINLACPKALVDKAIDLLVKALKP